MNELTLCLSVAVFVKAIPVGSEGLDSSVPHVLEQKRLEMQSHEVDRL